MVDLSIEVADWLCSAPGLAAVAATTAQLDDGLDTLTAGSRLRTMGLDPGRATAVVGAATARRRARSAWPDADELLFTPSALEQASDPAVAAWRARRLAGRHIWDLGAGVGGDTLALAAAGAEVTAVDVDAGRLRLLEHNAERRGLSVRTVVADALRVRPPADALIHSDPSRRRGGRRVRRLADHVPPVGELLATHGRAPGVALVLSPAVALDDPDLPDGCELEFVAVADELKETVAWTGVLREGDVMASATLLPGGHHRSRGTRAPTVEVRHVGEWLVEVAPAAVRARLHDEVAEEIGAGRVAERRALLTCDRPPPASPWYRARPVLAVLPARAKTVRRWLASVAGVPVEIAVHGLPADPGQWWRALGRPPRGPQGLRIELVRTDDGARAVVTDVRPTPSGTLRS